MSRVYDMVITLWSVELRREVINFSWYIGWWVCLKIIKKGERKDALQLPSTCFCETNCVQALC